MYQRERCGMGGYFRWLAMLTAIAAVSMACSSSSVTDSGTLDQVRLILTNDSELATHVWKSGEQIGSGNKLDPHSSRSILMTNLTHTDYYDVVVYAGRNGATLGSKTCRFKVPGSVGGDWQATWTGSGFACGQ